MRLDTHGKAKEPDRSTERIVRAGGTLTGEHGIGVEKLEYLSYLFSEDDLAVMERIRNVFDSKELSNPGKLLPLKNPHDSLRWS